MRRRIQISNVSITLLVLVSHEYKRYRIDVFVMMFRILFAIFSS